jgi:hypothetical protein
VSAPREVLSHAVADLLAVEVCGTSSDAFRAALLEVRRVWAAGLETFPNPASGTPDKSLRGNTLATPPAFWVDARVVELRDAAEQMLWAFSGKTVASVTDLIHRVSTAVLALRDTPPAAPEPFEEIEELPAVLPAQNSAAQTEQDTEATVWVDGETMAALDGASMRDDDGETDSETGRLLKALAARCRVVGGAE